MARISVIMPVYNSEDYLHDAIDSILSQSFVDFEFIIVDDCSTDVSYEICKSYEQADERIRLYRNSENMGIALTLNKAISYAKCKYVARMDSDDISLPMRFERQFAYLERNKNVSICGTLGSFISNSSEVIGEIQFPVDVDRIKTKARYYNPVVHPSFMVNTENIDYYYDEHWVPVEDFELIWRALAAGKDVVNLDEKLFLFRRKTFLSGEPSGLYKRFRYSSLLRARCSGGQRAGKPEIITASGLRYRLFSASVYCVRKAKEAPFFLSPIFYLAAAALSVDMFKYLFSNVRARFV